MKTVYEWIGETGARRLVVTNTQTKEKIEIPKQAALDRVATSKLYGAADNDELLIAKVVADKNGRVEEIQKWLDNRSQGELVRELQAQSAAKDAELAALKAKLAEAGLA